MNKIITTLLILAYCFSFSLLKSQTTPQKESKNILKPETLWDFGRVSEARISPDGTWVLYGITTYSLYDNKGKRNLYLTNIDNKLTTQLTNNDNMLFNAAWRPDGKKIAYLSAEKEGAQLWEMNPDGTNKKQITQIEGGVSGFMYAPTQDRILFTKNVKLDQTVHDLYPDLPKADARIIDDLMYRHWNAWSDYTYSHIFVASYKDGQVGALKDIMENEKFHSPLPPYGGMNQIAFSPDGNQIAYSCKKLIGKEFALSTNSDIYLYHIDKNTTLNISEGMMGYDKYPVFSNNGKYIVWQSMQTPGFEADKERLMLYNFENKSIVDLSAQFDQNTSNYIWSKNDKFIYFISGVNATYQLYKIEVNTKKITQITSGTHNISAFDMSKDKIVAELMSMSLPTELFIIEDKVNDNILPLTSVNKNILDHIEMGKVEERWVKTTDNKNMLVWVIYPPHFDPNKKYPALLYCQGGPQSAVSQFFSYRWNFQMMAANDYIVVAPNRRGLPTFGQEWNDQISGDYGGQNMKDYLSAIDALAKESFVDETKLGAVGASYGGFSVYWLAGNHNKRFKAFISHCGMFNLESWYATTEEMFFANHDLGGPYWTGKNNKSFNYFSPHKFVGNWDTPILVIHGEKDFRIPYTEGMQAFNAAQLQNIPSRFLYFPNETHFVLKPQNSVLWQREFFRWLDTYLK